MRKIPQYRRYASECRTVAEQLNGGARHQLAEIAAEWDRLAAEQELQSQSGGPTESGSWKAWRTAR